MKQDSKLAAEARQAMTVEVSNDPNGALSHSPKDRVPLAEVMSALDVVRVADDARIADVIAQRQGLINLPTAIPGIVSTNPKLIMAAFAAAFCAGERLTHLGPVDLGGDTIIFGVTRSALKAAETHSLGEPNEDLSGHFSRARLARDLVVDWAVSGPPAQSARVRQQRIIGWLRPIKERIGPTVAVELVDRIWAYEGGRWTREKGATYVDHECHAVIVLSMEFIDDLEYVLYREMHVAHRADGRITDDEWAALKAWAGVGP